MDIPISGDETESNPGESVPPRKVKAMNEKTHESSELPEFLRPLFWEYDFGKIDIRRHADSIMHRIMERGDWQAMCWLRNAYSNGRIVSFLERRGKRVLPPRELNFWAFVSGIPEEIRETWIDESLEKSTIWERRHAF